MTNTVPFTKKQHYIPQFYLKNFSQDAERLYIYDKSKGERGEIRHQTTVEVAHQNHFYTYRTKNGTKENLEDFFCRFEGDAATIIEKVHKSKVITPEEKEKLALFIAFLYTRTPASKSRTEETIQLVGEAVSRKMFANTSKEWMKKFFKEKLGQDMSDEEIEDLKDFAQDPKRSRIEFDVPKEYWIKNMLQMAVEIAPLFFGMDWLFVFTDRPYALITSDNPFLLVPPDDHDKFRGVGLMTDKARKIIPLRSNMCLVMGDLVENPAIRFGNVEKNFFRQVNEHLVLECERFCFSPEEGKLQKLVKELKPYSIPKVTRMRVC